MTTATVVNIEVDCPVHDEKCGYAVKTYSVRNNVGELLGKCTKCGYRIEIADRFGVRYRRPDGTTLTVEEFKST